MIFFFLLLLSSIGFAENSRRVAAVHDLIAQGVETSSAQIISDRLRNEFVKTGAFTIVERGQMESILKEQGFQQSGACSNDACVVEMGQLLGVDCMITGSIGKIGRTFTMGLRMIDVKTGKITTSANVDCKCEIDDLLSSSTPEIVHKLLSEINKGAPQAELLPVAKKQSTPSKAIKRFGWKLSLGTGTLVGLGAGFLMNQSGKKDADKADAIKQTYLAGQTNVGYEAFAVDYKSKRDSASKAFTWRNVGYVVSGLCASGLVLTFTF